MASRINRDRDEPVYWDDDNAFVPCVEMMDAALRLRPECRERMMSMVVITRKGIDP